MRLSSIGTGPVRVSELGFGCASIGNLYAAIDDTQAMDVLDAAWDCGIRYFDTAPFYGGGLSEERLGAFLASKRRSECTVSTKVGKILHSVSRRDAEDHGFVDGHPVKVEFDYSGDGIMRSVEASLKRLSTDRLDIVFVHDIGAFTHGAALNAFHMDHLLKSGLERLEYLRSQGVIGAFGLGVNEVDAPIEVMRHVDLDCILLANRYTLLDRAAERTLLPLCRERNVAIIAGGIFNSGILATGPGPNAKFDYVQASDEICNRVSAMQRIANDAGEDLTTVALQFPAREPVVKSVLLGTADRHLLASNIERYGRQLSDSIFKQIGPFTLR